MALVQRLRHNVIKTGLRKINSAYSKISFKDICSKLNLENEQDAEFLVAKVNLSLFSICCSSYIELTGHPRWNH